VRESCARTRVGPEPVTEVIRACNRALERARFEEQDHPRACSERGNPKRGPSSGRIDGGGDRVDEEGDEGGGGHLHEPKEDLEDQFAHLLPLDGGTIRHRDAPRDFEGLLQRRRTGGLPQTAGREPWR